MKPSNKSVQIFNSLKRFEIKELAMEQDNLSLYQELLETNNYEKILQKLGVYNNYLVYHKKISNLLELNAIENSTEIAQLLNDYYTFLLEKICFPD